VANEPLAPVTDDTRCELQYGLAMQAAKTVKTVSFVIALLGGDDQRHDTVNALFQAGFSGREIGAASETAELVVQDNALARADVAGHGLFDVLVAMGAPEQQARRFAREFAAHHTIVTVQTERPKEAAAILRQHAATSMGRW
jgi:hypothetical protein